MDQLDIDGMVVTVDGREAFHQGEGAAVFDIPHGGVVVRFLVDSSGIRIYELTVEVHDVDGQVLRMISIPEMKTAILDGIQEELPIQRVEPRGGVDTLELRKEWPNGDRLDVLLGMVAVFYNMAIDRDLPPTQHVAKRFKVSRSTAGRMVAAARDAGKNLRSPAPYPGKRKGKTNGKATAEGRGAREHHDGENRP